MDIVCQTFERTADGNIPAIPLGLRINPFKYIVGKWRMFWKLCPECNSDAPKIDSCQVCHNNRRAFYNYTHFIRRLWWNRYYLKSCNVCNVFPETEQEKI